MHTDHDRERRRETPAKPTPRTLVDQVVRSPGRPLERRDRVRLESRFGQPLSHVRVHADDGAARSAQAIDALAYTVGDHVVFGAGQYAPATGPGTRLLAHELAHVIQRPPMPARAPTADGLRLSEPADQSEREAVALSDSVSGPDRPGSAGASPTARRTLAPGGPGAALSVHRTIRVGADTLDKAGVEKLTTSLVSGPLRDLVRQVGVGAVREVINELHADPEQLTFPDSSALASNVRQRVLVSRYMRTSQGSTPLMKAFSYPNRRGDQTVGVGPKVNDNAKRYWGSVQGDPNGVYWFDLSPAGKANAYEALIRLFDEKSKPAARTLIHCDYLVSVIEFRAYAENVGRERFNALVASGALPMRLKYDGFTDLVSKPLPPPGGGPSAAVGRQPPLQLVPVTSEDELLAGDHVVFFNHETYDLLNQGPREVWRLENAIVIDKSKGHLRYQGHGYFAPVTRDVLLGKILHYYNLNVATAKRLVTQASGSGQAAAGARQKLKTDHNVSEGPPGHWQVSGASQLCGGRPIHRELKPLTEAEAPALHNPCDGKIWARRPIEKTP